MSREIGHKNAAGSNTATFITHCSAAHAIAGRHQS
jgi:hypothetical protein